MDYILSTLAILITVLIIDLIGFSAYMIVKLAYKVIRYKRTQDIKKMMFSKEKKERK